MTVERVSYYNLGSMSRTDLHSAKRALYYRDHEDTVADALAHWYDHVRDDFAAAKARGELDKHLPLIAYSRKRWAVRLNDARRALRDLR